MATKIATLKENGDTVYPVTKVECVYNDSNQNVSDLLNDLSTNKANKDLSNIGTALAPVQLYTGSAGGVANYTINQSMNNFSSLLFIFKYGSNPVYHVSGYCPVSLFKTMTNPNTYLVNLGNQWMGWRYVSDTQIRVDAAQNTTFVTVYGIK